MDCIARLVILLIALLAAGCAATTPATDTTVAFVDPSDGAAPYSRTVRVGQTVYISGVLGSRDGRLVEGGIGPETDQALSNIESALADHGASLSNIVKCQVFLADIGEFQAMNDVYKARLQPPRPARTTVAVDLVAGARIEIDCIAALSETL
ncbi:MAG: RidA family protein [Pseudomonadota bacterium]